MAISSHTLCFVLLLVFFCPSLSQRLMPITCPPHESHALLRFKAAFNDTEGTLSSWVNGTNCCTDWDGISRDNHTNHVVSVSVTHDSDSSIVYALEGVISESLCQLRFLTSLTIWRVSGTTLPPCLGNLSRIQSLYLSGNGLSGMILPFICLLTRLTDLGLSDNGFNGSIPSCLGNLSSLTVLDLASNRLNGSIPSCLGNLSSLTYLSLDSNRLSGSILASLGSLTLLRHLYLSNNQLSGKIPYSLDNLSLLERLAIADNQLSGTIPPSFSQLSSLTLLYAHGNRFNETVSFLSLPPSLFQLYLSLNHFQSISETFFHKLTRLNYLRLSDCVINISTTWIPSFHLFELSLMSCRIDGQFPSWISTQSGLKWMEITNASLFGVIPFWLWETRSLLYPLNLSGNHLEGRLSSNTSIWMQLEELDVSRNRLSGCIPSMWSSSMEILLLNDNCLVTIFLLAWVNYPNSQC